MEVIFNCLYNRKTRPTVGEVVDISKVHSQTVQPYVTKLRSNLENGVLVTQLAKLVQQHACLIQ